MVAQHPPPICPKCGSHRTEVVGLADDGQTVIVRCNGCGERSEVKMAPGDTLTAAGMQSTHFRRVNEQHI